MLSLRWLKTHSLYRLIPYNLRTRVLGTCLLIKLTKPYILSRFITKSLDVAGLISL
jgi:hypothetical protein